MSKVNKDQVQQISFQYFSFHISCSSLIKFGVAVQHVKPAVALLQQHRGQ